MTDRSSSCVCDPVENTNHQVIAVGKSVRIIKILGNVMKSQIYNEFLPSYIPVYMSDMFTLTWTWRLLSKRFSLRTQKPESLV